MASVCRPSRGRSLLSSSLTSSYLRLVCPTLPLAFISPFHSTWSRRVVCSLQLEALHCLSDMPLHALLLVSFRLLSVDANSSSQFCAASRVPYRTVSQWPAHALVTWLIVLKWQIDKHLFFRAGAWKYALRTSTRAATIPPRLPWRSQTAELSASPAAGVDAHSSGLACVLYSFTTHLARTLGFPGCPLSVSAHPVLMGALRSRVGTLPWRLLCTSCGNECTPLLLVSLWRTALDQAHPPLLSFQCQPSHTLSSSCSP